MFVVPQVFSMDIKMAMSLMAENARAVRVAKLTLTFIVRIRHTHVRYFYSFLLLRTAVKN